MDSFNEELGLNIPGHVAVILDGNGRWAKKRHMPRTYGHMQGSKVVEVMLYVADDLGVKYFTVYAFSTENWKRSTDEVSTLMNILRKYLKDCVKKSMKNNVRCRVIGRKEELSADIIESINNLEEKTKNNKGAEKLSIRTRTNYLIVFKNFMEWCYREGYVSNDYSSNIIIPTKKVIQKIGVVEKVPFDKKDLLKFFNPDVFLKKIRDRKKNWRFYIPLIAMTTGARINEICQLRINDIKKEKNIWYYDLNDEEETKSLKTIKSKRKVPIHSIVLGQGFLEFVKKYGLDFLTYPKEVLKEVPGTFSGSAFVSQTVGVDNVCERAALAACRKEDKEKIKQPGCGSEGKEKSYMQQNCDSRENQKKMLVQGRLLLKKKAKDGMTLAIAEREWSVRFDET